MQCSEMPSGWRCVLRAELDADEGSFLLKLRGELVWDRAGFSRLVRAMEDCCRALTGEETVERWQANGFWYLSWWVKDWASHPSFPRPYPAEYYQAAFERLDTLAFWYFFGESPCAGGSLPPI